MLNFEREARKKRKESMTEEVLIEEVEDDFSKPMMYLFDE